jgi:HNH endonuclease
VVDRTTARFDDAGRFQLHADASAIVGAEIDAALREARDALYRAGNHEATWTDALLEVCRRSLDMAGSASRSDRYRVYLHVNAEKAWLNGGAQLPPSVRSKVLCDCTVHPMVLHNGTPVSVGRATRVIASHTRRVVLDRDVTCRYPGCPSKQLEVHHVVHWEHGGRTDTANLAGLCSYHHHRHHDGTYTVTGNADTPDGLRFTRPDGTVIESGPRPVTPTGPLHGPPPGLRYVHPTGERLERAWVSFARNHPPPRAAEPGFVRAG